MSATSLFKSYCISLAYKNYHIYVQNVQPCGRVNFYFDKEDRKMGTDSSIDSEYEILENNSEWVELTIQNLYIRYHIIILTIMKENCLQALVLYIGTILGEYFAFSPSQPEDLIYVVSRILFNIINIAYPKGQTYAEFLDDIYKEVPEYENADYKALIESTKKYFTESENDISNIVSHRTNHNLLKHNNANDTSPLYPPILDFKKEGMVFDYYLMHTNKKNKNYDLITHFDDKIIKHLQARGLCFTLEELSSYRKSYRKLRKKKIDSMNMQELNMYLEIMTLKQKYICESESEFIATNLLSLEDDLKLNYILRKDFYNNHGGYLNIFNMIQGISYFLVYMIHEASTTSIPNLAIFNSIIDYLECSYKFNQGDFIIDFDSCKDDLFHSSFSRNFITVDLLANLLKNNIVKSYKNEITPEVIKLSLLTNKVIIEESELQKIVSLANIFFSYTKSLHDQSKELQKKKMNFSIKEPLERLLKALSDQQITCCDFSIKEHEISFDYPNYEKFFQQCALNCYTLLYSALKQSITYNVQDNSHPCAIIDLSTMASTMLHFINPDKGLNRVFELPKKLYRQTFHISLANDIYSVLFPNKYSVDFSVSQYNRKIRMEIISLLKRYDISVY